MAEAKQRGHTPPAKPADLADAPEEKTRTMSASDLPQPDPPAEAPRKVSSRMALPAVVDELAEGAAPAGPTPIRIVTHKMPIDPDPRLILLREPDSARAAAFRVLRHRLEERVEHEGTRVYAVTSAEPEEGKTTCAANLALALGECGRARVLLVEANLRSPALAALFGFMPPECFALQLERHRQRPAEPWSVVEACVPSLHVLAVKPTPEARPLLDGVAVGVAFDLLRRAGYHYIVVDTPHVLGSADTNLVEEHCDGVLLAARARATSSRKLRAAVEQLAPTKILGLALIDA
jgi:Mrp family chromosome partitioning ATPase